MRNDIVGSPVPERPWAGRSRKAEDLGLGTQDRMASIPLE